MTPQALNRIVCTDCGSNCALLNVQTTETKPNSFTLCYQCYENLEEEEGKRLELLDLEEEVS